MATDMVDDHEMREAQRDYLDFLDDDVSGFTLLCPCGHNKSWERFHCYFTGTLLVVKFSSDCDALNSYHIDKIFMKSIISPLMSLFRLWDPFIDDVKPLKLNGTNPLSDFRSKTRGFTRTRSGTWSVKTKLDWSSISTIWGDATRAALQSKKAFVPTWTHCESCSRMMKIFMPVISNVILTT